MVGVFSSANSRFQAWGEAEGLLSLGAENMYLPHDDKYRTFWEIIIIYNSIKMKETHLVTENIISYFVSCKIFSKICQKTFVGYIYFACQFEVSTVESDTFVICKFVNAISSIISEKLKQNMIFSSLVPFITNCKKKYFPNRLRKERFETCQKISSCCCNTYKTKEIKLWRTLIR
jgi:hypothetical protein